MINHITLQITNKCNLNCSHCYMDKFNNKDMPLQTIEFFLKDLNLMNIKSVTLLGGEIFIRKDIFEVLQLFKKYNIQPNIITNGMLVNKQILIKLKELHINNLTYSLDGMEIEHNKQRNNLKSFQRVILSISEAKEMGYSITINCVVTRNNQNSIINFIHFLDNKVDVIKLLYYTPFNRKQFKNRLNFNEWNDLIKKISYLNYRDLKISIQQPYYCKKNNNQKNICNLSAYFITTEGEVYPCLLLKNSSYSLGNIYNESFYEISNKEWSLKKTYNYCVGYSNIMYNDINIPYSESLSTKNLDFGCVFQCTKQQVKQVNENLYVY